MSRPETYYEAKAAFLAAADECREHLPANAVEALLAAVGWSAPAPARDSAGKLIKVFRVDDLLYVLPPSFRQEHPLDQGGRYTGVMVGTSKADVADRAVPTWARSGRMSGISAVAPTDLRYPLAVAYPHKIVVQRETVSGSPYGERHLVYLNSLKLETGQ